jgi:multidrug efflux pump subunit AcrB
VKKQSSALLQVVAVYSPNRHARRAVPVELRHHQRARHAARVPGVGEAGLFGALDYSMRIWLDLDRMSSLGITRNDVVRRSSRRTCRPRSAWSARRRCSTASASS